MGKMEGQHGKLIMRKVVGKAFTAGGRFDFFLDSGLCLFICIPVIWDLTYTQSFRVLFYSICFSTWAINKYNMGDSMNE